jgi:hypothetical protein
VTAMVWPHWFGGSCRSRAADSQNVHGRRMGQRVL